MSFEFRSPSQEDDPPLELAEIPPRPPPAPLPPSEAELTRKRKRRRWVTLAVTLAVLGGGGALLFTDQGRGLLPAPAQAPAAEIAREVETRAVQVVDDVERTAKEATSDALYTYTDANGVVHIVDTLEKVPDAYRDRVQKRE